MATFIEKLKGLHAQIIDSLDGYGAALIELEDAKLRAFVQQMIQMRNAHHRELDQCLHSLGERPNEAGTFMSTVHKTIIKIRSVFTGVNGNIIPGLIDGESRILDQYKDVIDASDRLHITETLQAQSRALEAKIHELKSLEAAA